MRGLELPINMIIVVAVAVLVLTVIAAFFTGSLGSGINTITVEQAFTKGCQLLRSVGDCERVETTNIAGYRMATGGKGLVEDPTATGSTAVTVFQVCQLKGASTREACLRLCGCPA